MSGPQIDGVNVPAVGRRGVGPSEDIGPLALATARIEGDLCVGGGGWTAPTSVLDISGALPLYQADAARYVANPRLLPENVVACGGLVGGGRVPEMVAIAQVIGAVAAGRAAAIAHGHSIIPGGRRPL